MTRISCYSVLTCAAAVLLTLQAPGVLWAKDEVEDLGRLFIDAEQREKLEAVRRGTYQAEKEEKSRVSNVRVNGLMIRSGGSNVVWVNGVNTMDGSAPAGINVNPKTADRDNYTIKVDIEGKPVNMKPGQNWSEGTGTVRDNY